MSEHEMKLNPREERARDAVHTLGEVGSNPEFRERLGREFMTGKIMDRPPLESPRPSIRRQFVRWAYIPAAAALLLLALGIGNRGPGWKVVGTSSGGSVMVDGTRIGMKSMPRMESRLKAGERIEIEGGDLTLLGLGTLAVQATSGTAMTVPNMPGRWYGDTMRARVEQGEARFITGPLFAGRRLIVETPEGRVEVTGTVISVLRDGAEGVTCICVMTGEARIGSRDGKMELIPAGMRKVMFADGRDPMVVDILPEHRDGLIPFVTRNKKYLND